MTNAHGPYSETEAEAYDQDREHEPLWALEHQYVSNWLSVRPGSILDIPVGTGRFFSLYSGRRVLGVDLSDYMLKQARYRADSMPQLDVELIEAGINSMPVDSASYDLAICWRMMHLLPPSILPSVLGELSRVCRGAICVQFYFPASATRRLISRAWRWARRAALPFSGKRRLTPWSHIRYYQHAPEDVMAAAAAAKLKVIRRDYIGYYEGTSVEAITLEHAG